LSQRIEGGGADAGFKANAPTGVVFAGFRIDEMQPLGREDRTEIEREEKISEKMPGHRAKKKEGDNERERTYLSAGESKSANRGGTWLSAECVASGPASGSSVVVAVIAVAVMVGVLSTSSHSVPSSPLSVHSSPESGEAGPLCVTLSAAMVLVFFALN